MCWRCVRAAQTLSADFEGLVRDGLARRGEPDKDDDSESKRIDRPHRVTIKE